MEPAHEIPSLELLLAQEGWVRALARKLVSRESEAEDVAQSALAVALERPPRSGQSAPVLRAWLAQVARRLAIGGQRTDSRRLDRERRAARAEALPSASEIHALEEERRIVVEALLSLHEPFRTTLLLRYYRGLEPIEIARAMSVPDSTVRNRLARGLAQLKQRLEARQGSDWRASCALLAGPLAPATKSVLIGKGVVMGVNLKVAVSCSVVALAGLAWWEMRGSGSAGPKPAQLEVASVQRVSNETDKPAEDAAKPAATRAKVEADPAASGATPVADHDPVGILVYGSVRQKDGVATRGRARVRLLSSEGRDLTSSADEQGAFAFTGLTPGEWRLTASLTGYRGVEQTLQLDGAQPVRRVDLALEGRLRIPVRFQTPDGRRLSDAIEKNKPAGMLFRIQLGVVACEGPVPTTLPRKTLAQFERYGLGEYRPAGGSSGYLGMPPTAHADGADGELIIENRFPMTVCAIWRNSVLDSRRIESAPSEITFVLRPEQVLGVTGGFRVRLVDAVDHAPLGAAVNLIQHNYRASLGFAKNADGQVEFATLPPGLVTVSLTYPDHEDLVETIDIEAGSVRDLGTRELARTTSTDLHVVDGAGQPLGEVMFHFLSARDEGVPRPQQPTYVIGSAQDGLLRIESGPASRWLIADDKNWTCEPVLLRGTSGQRIVMQRGSELVAVIGESVPADSLMLVRDRNGTCVVIEEADQGQLVRCRLPSGHYEVELATFDATILKKSIELGDKPLVVDLAP